MRDELNLEKYQSSTLNIVVVFFQGQKAHKLETAYVDKQYPER